MDEGAEQALGRARPMPRQPWHSARQVSGADATSWEDEADRHLRAGQFSPSHGESRSRRAHSVWTCSSCGCWLQSARVRSRHGSCAGAVGRSLHRTNSRPFRRHTLRLHISIPKGEPTQNIHLVLHGRSGFALGLPPLLVAFDRLRESLMVRHDGIPHLRLGRAPLTS